MSESMNEIDAAVQAVWLDAGVWLTKYNKQENIQSTQDGTLYVATDLEPA